jgi:hypothetical protein
MKEIAAGQSFWVWGFVHVVPLSVATFPSTSNKILPRVERTKLKKIACWIFNALNVIESAKQGSPWSLQWTRSFGLQR